MSICDFGRAKGLFKDRYPSRKDIIAVLHDQEQHCSCECNRNNLLSNLSFLVVSTWNDYPKHHFPGCLGNPPDQNLFNSDVRYNPVTSLNLVYEPA